MPDRPSIMTKVTKETPDEIRDNSTNDVVVWDVNIRGLLGLISGERLVCHDETHNLTYVIRYVKEAGLTVEELAAFGLTPLS